MLNGDINLRLNKKLGIALLCGISLFATADFVSLVDTKSAGGIVIEKETMTVGSVVFRMDSKNPGDIYGGTWELIRGDASIRLGNGGAQSGSMIGNNTPIVPVPEHTHTATFNGNPLPAHSHTTSWRYFRPAGEGSDNHRNANLKGGHGNQNFTTGGTSAGTPTGTVAINKAGTSDAKLDVRGQYITINVWKRIS